MNGHSPRVRQRRFGGGRRHASAETGQFGDRIKAGVIDPAKVTRLALQNAASIVALMLMSEVLIADIKQDAEMAPVGAGQGGMY